MRIIKKMMVMMNLGNAVVMLHQIVKGNRKKRK